MRSYRFHSVLFELEPGEDDEVNPRIYGRQLSLWLKRQLERRGLSVEPVIHEDWGRCLVCSRDPVLLWVGCGSTPDHDALALDGPQPPRESVEWWCFAEAEPSLVQRWFRGISGGEARAALDRTLFEILFSEPRIRLFDPAPPAG